MKGKAIGRTNQIVLLKPSELSPMTCLIKVHNDKYCCLASDTLSVHEKGSEEIHKIAYNKENKIVIGSTGQNGIIYPERMQAFANILPSEIKIIDYMQFLCDCYNGHNLQTIITLLEGVSRKMLSDLYIEPTLVSPPVIVDYFVMAWNEKKKQNELFYMIVRRNSVKSSSQRSDSIESECIANLPPIVFDGSYEGEYNKLYRNYNIENLSMEEIRDWAVSKVQEQINKDSKKPVKDRFVGGSVEWIAVDKDWNIETNIL